jgi:phage terminase large subunit-like protein
MYDNPHLPEDIRQALEEAYAGTSLGAQELLGQIIEQDENALWRREHIERNRVVFDDIERIIIRRTVGVDPSGGAGEQGIVCTAKTEKIELPGFEQPVATGFVLADATVHLPAAAWGLRAVDTAIEWDADDICVEKNFGGDMAVEVIRAAAEKRGVPIPIRFTIASRGKRVRAAPVSALTEQNRFGFAGVFEELESQLCTWTEEIGYSPDRLDAMVWGPHHMGLVHMSPAGHGTIGTQAARRPIAGPGGGRSVPPAAAAEQRRTAARTPGQRVM